MTSSPPSLHQTHNLDILSSSESTYHHDYHYPLTPIPSASNYIHPVYRTHPDFVHYFDGDDAGTAFSGQDYAYGNDIEDDGFPVPPPRNPLRLGVKPLFSTNVRAEEMAIDHRHDDQGDDNASDNFSLADTLNGSPRTSTSLRGRKVIQDLGHDSVSRTAVLSPSPSSSDEWHTYRLRSSTSTAAGDEESTIADHNRMSHFTEILTPPMSDDGADDDELDDSSPIPSPLPSQRLRRARPLADLRQTVTRPRPLFTVSASSLKDLRCPPSLDEAEWRLFLLEIEGTMSTGVASTQNVGASYRTQQCPHSRKGLAAGKKSGGLSFLQRKKNNPHTEYDAQVLEYVVERWNQRWENRGVRIALDIVGNESETEDGKRRGRRRFLKMRSEKQRRTAANVGQKGFRVVTSKLPAPGWDLDE